MANKSRFVVAEGSIKNFFKTDGRYIYNDVELREILEERRTIWNLPISMNLEKFIEKLTGREILKKHEIVFLGYIGKKIRYSYGEVKVFHLAVSLVSKGYLSHYTAAFLNGLTTQVPKTIYISYEQSQKNVVDRSLEQKAINNAFSKPQRHSNVNTIFQDYTLLIHNSMYSNRAGVFTLEGIPITSIEKTLIDITVRPDYAGGVFSVLEIYREAINRISMNKLMAILDKLNFIYPYHQAIGFYLQKAGIEDKRLIKLREKAKEFKFYLTYQIEDKEFDENWQIYFPKGM